MHKQIKIFICDSMFILYRVNIDQRIGSLILCLDLFSVLLEGEKGFFGPEFESECTFLLSG